MQFIRTYLKTLLFFGVIGLLGGFFVGLYALDGYPEDIVNSLAAEAAELGLPDMPLDILIAVITAVQSMGYGIILGALGIIIAKRIGLWRDEVRIESKPAVLTAIVAVLAGAAMILFDILFFAKYSEAISNSYANKPSVVYILATVTYGAVIEEIMLRLFWMSLVAFILHKMLDKGESPSVAVLVAANVISATLFAAGHLPATFMMIGNSPLIIARCFLLNGGIGLALGYLYRKHGLRYAMMAHGGAHIVSKLIWVIFI